MPGQRPALRYGGGTAVRQHLPQSVSIQGSSSGISREDCPSSWEERRLGPQSRPRGGRVTCVCRRCGFGDKEPRIRPSPAASSKAGVGSSKSRGGGLPAAPRPLPGWGAVVPGSHAAQERTPRLCLVRWGPRCWGGGWRLNRLRLERFCSSRVCAYCSHLANVSHLSLGEKFPNRKLHRKLESELESVCCFLLQHGPPSAAPFPGGGGGGQPGSPAFSCSGWACCALSVTWERLRAVQCT